MGILKNVHEKVLCVTEDLLTAIQVSWKSFGKEFYF